MYNIDYTFVSDTEPSPLILSQQKEKNIEMWLQIIIPYKLKQKGMVQ